MMVLMTIDVPLRNVLMIMLNVQGQALSPRSQRSSDLTLTFDRWGADASYGGRKRVAHIGCDLDGLSASGEDIQVWRIAARAFSFEAN